jgi:Domain of unknown function (DUF4260)
MHIVHTQTARRAAYAVLSSVLLAIAIALLVAHDGGWWLFAAFIVAPDLALLAGMSPALQKGQLHPRAVPLYNALHSFWGPGVLALAGIVLPLGAVIGALAWALHISIDRTVGYGMRTRDGFQR